MKTFKTTVIIYNIHGDDQYTVVVKAADQAGVHEQMQKAFAIKPGYIANIVEA